MPNVTHIDPYTNPEFLEWKSKHKENNCCTVVALWQATGNPLEQCAEYMSKFGRRLRKGMPRKDWNNALESMRKFKTKKGPYSQRNRITVSKFLDKHPKGTYYVANNGHAFVIKDGVLFDHTVGLRRQITCAYRVYTQEELAELRQ